MSTVAKYLDKYSKRHKSPTPEKQDFHKMMTDRQAYISYLEVQLERVTQACLQSQGFNERIEQIQTQLNTAEEKILNITRLVKLQQNYSENQEEEFNNLKEKVESITRSGGGHDLQVDELKVSYRKHEGRIEGIENRIKGYEDRVAFLLSQSQKDDATRVGHFDEFARELDRCIKETENRIMVNTI